MNNLAGSIAYFAGLVLWVSSVNWVRRRLFEWFFRLHIACFVVFFAFSSMHYVESWKFFVPGERLWVGWVQDVRPSMEGAPPTAAFVIP